MTRERTLLAVTFTALLAAGQVHSAPGAGGSAQSGNQAGGKPKTEHPEKSMDSTGTGTRQQAQTHNPDAGKGESTSAEMQQRQQERKEIQEQYRTSEQTGEKAKKKPWWKFWEGDEPS